jgi:hypothetical protein
MFVRVQLSAKQNLKFAQIDKMEDHVFIDAIRLVESN